VRKSAPAGRRGAGLWVFLPGVQDVRHLDDGLHFGRRTSIAGLRIEVGLTALSGKREKYLDFLHRFAASHGGDADSFRQMLASRDFMALQRAAHGLKGTASMLGAEQIAQTTGEIERDIKSAGDQVGARAIAGLIDALDDAMRTLVSGLQAFRTTGSCGIVAV